MSLDSQVALPPYESSSFATLFRGQNKSLYAYLWYHVAHCLAPIVPPASLGERWWRQPPKGAFPSPAGRFACFPRSKARL